MKNKSLIAVFCVIILLAVTLFIVMQIIDSPLPETEKEISSEINDKNAPDNLFDKPEEYVLPQINNGSGAAATEYEPVFPVNISSEGIKSAVTLHYLVPEQFRDIYSEILSGLREYKNEIRFSSPVNEDAFLRALIYVRDLNPELFFIDWSVYNYKTTADNEVAEISFNFFYDNISEKANELETKVAEIVGEANRYPNLFERELFIHDWLVNNTTYLIDEGETGTALGAILNGKARCEGYARAFQLLMLRIGVPTLSVIGNAENERHMWNAVDLYGKYYFVDVTFDDNSSETNITSYSENEIGHSCFNMPAEIISRTHSISDSGSRDKYGAYQNLILPECTSYDLNYYRIRGLMVENSEQFKYILERNSSEKRVCVFFKGEMPSQEQLQGDFRSFFEKLYTNGGYSIYYTPSNSPVFMRNVYEISWTVEQ